MAIDHMPDEFFDAVAHHLPPGQPVGPKGGRPRVGHRTALRVIWFVLTAGTRWEDVPPELGCSGRTAHRRLRSWEEAGIWDRLKTDLLGLLMRVADLKRASSLDDTGDFSSHLTTCGFTVSDVRASPTSVLLIPGINRQPS